MPDRLAIVEDDVDQRALLEARLQRQGFAVASYGDRPSARRAFEAGDIPELAIFDINLAGDDAADRGGFELCRELHELPKGEQVPVIFLTRLEDHRDHLMGLSLAVAYVQKPTDPEILTAQVRALLAWARRLYGPRNDPERPLACGALRVDPAASQATWKGQPLALTYTEFEIQKALAERPGRVATFEDLCEAIGGTVADNTIATHIHHVRSKFQRVDPDFPGTTVIRAVPRRGYMWVPPADDP